MTVGVRVQHRRDTAANWTSNNPVLLAGERGVEIPGGKEKVGDGSTAWTSLEYTTDISNLPNTVAFGSSGNPNAAGVFNVQHPSYGGVADAKTITDGVITGNQFSTTSGALTSADAGKAVTCVAAGSTTAPFTATISSVASGVVTLSAIATTNVTGGQPSPTVPTTPASFRRS